MIGKISVFLLLVIISAPGFLCAQTNVQVDENGVMRWPQTGEEVYGFGVNYTTPFAHAYRSAIKLGIDPKEAIKNDVYHFTRLDFDAYRVHVWDTEISDTLGNLIQNEHLDLFDFMLHEMKQRGMKFLITPIAFWGNGWPEPDGKTPGFSNKYGKAACLTNEDAVKAQINYLKQFLLHKNPYTGIAYKDDPSIVAFEVSNEPHHRQPADSVIRYIKLMVDAMRSTGLEKPVFYNITHSVHLMDAYYEAGIDGGTFQWYPTGLGSQEALKGNILPNVDKYEITFANHEGFNSHAKVVYEFDAADVDNGYVYPAMARSFRTAGIQWATHFAYDPTFLAYANTEYNTHYMNLIYTPRKALALKIAGKVFHEIPLYSDFGSFPADTLFGDFHVSYKNDLAILNNGTEFIYSNDNQVKPKNPAQLESVSGWGNSSIVQYGGTGAYFVDKIEKGIWRLEVLPDVVRLKDPFGTNSLDRKLADVVWKTNEMKLMLPTLGEDFDLIPVNQGNTWEAEVKQNSFSVRPGTYLLVKRGKKLSVDPEAMWKNIKLNEYSAPKQTLEQSTFKHTPPIQVNEGEPILIEASVVSPKELGEVTLILFDGWRPVEIPMTTTGRNSFCAQIQSKFVKKGILKYFIVVDEGSESTVFPGEGSKLPSEWDFHDAPFEINVLEKDDPLYLFDAMKDDAEVNRNWLPGSYLRPSASPDKGHLVLKIDQLFQEDPENLNAKPIYDYSLRYCFKDRLDGRKTSLSNYKQISIKARNLKQGKLPVQIALIQSDGKAFGAIVELDASPEYQVQLANLKPVQIVTLPRPYPTFLPYFFSSSGDGGSLDLSRIESIQISLGPGLSEEQKTASFELAVESVRLE